MIKKSIQTVSLVAAGTVATASSSATFVLNKLDTDSVVFELNVTAASGTTPTLDVYIQQSLDGTNFIDVAHFIQITASSATAYRLFAPTISANIADLKLITGLGDATLAANSVSAIPLISPYWKIKYVIAGTTPSFTIGVNAYLS